MRKVALEDIIGLAAYEKVRQDARQKIIELKQRRRVSVGANVTLVFENRDTVIFQIQEMMRAEKITDLDKIREEIDVYNELIPAAGELSATLFLEIEEQTHIREELLKFLGIDVALLLRVGGHSIRARFEEGRSKEDKISAVQYVKFPLTDEALREFIGGGPAEIVIDHPNYKATAEISNPTRRALIGDLAG